MKEWFQTVIVLCVFGFLRSAISWITVIHDYESLRKRAISSQLLKYGVLEHSHKPIAFYRGGIAEHPMLNHSEVSHSETVPSKTVSQWNLVFPDASRSWSSILLRVSSVLAVGVTTDMFGHSLIFLCCGSCMAIGGLLWPWTEEVTTTMSEPLGSVSHLFYNLVKILLAVGGASDVPSYVALSKCFLQSKCPTFIVACWIASRLAGVFVARTITACHRRSPWLLEYLLSNNNIDDVVWKSFLMDIMSIQDSSFLSSVVIISSILIFALSVRLFGRSRFSNLWNPIDLQPQQRIGDAEPLESTGFETVPTRIEKSWPLPSRTTTVNHENDSSVAAISLKQQQQQQQLSCHQLEQNGRVVSQILQSQQSRHQDFITPQGCISSHGMSRGDRKQHLVSSFSTSPDTTYDTIPLTSKFSFSWTVWLSSLVTKRNILLFCLTVCLSTSIQASHNDMFLRRLETDRQSTGSSVTPKALGAVVPNAPLWPYVGYVVSLIPMKFTSHSSSNTQDKNHYLISSVSPTLQILLVAVLACPLVGFASDVLMRWEKLSAAGLILLILGRNILRSPVYCQTMGHSLLGLSFALFWGCRGSALASSSLSGTEGSSYAVLKCGDFIGVTMASYLLSYFSKVTSPFSTSRSLTLPRAPLFAFILSVLISGGLIILLSTQYPTLRRRSMISVVVQPTGPSEKLDQPLSVGAVYGSDKDSFHDPYLEIDRYPPRPMCIGV